MKLLPWHWTSEPLQLDLMQAVNLLHSAQQAVNPAYICHRGLFMCVFFSHTTSVVAQPCVTRAWCVTTGDAWTAAAKCMTQAPWCRRKKQATVLLPWRCSQGLGGVVVVVVGGGVCLCLNLPTSPPPLCHFHVLTVPAFPRLFAVSPGS